MNRVSLALVVCLAACLALPGAAMWQAPAAGQSKNSSSDSPAAIQKMPSCYYAPAPPYTKEAKKKKFQGVVRVEGVVGLDGRVTNIRIIKSPGLGLDESVTKTLQGWKCTPAIGPQGKPVPAIVPFEISFRVNRP